MSPARKPTPVRRWGAGATSAALLGGLIVVAAGSPAHAEPVTPNPELGPVCAMDVALVLDASDSIEIAGATQQVRDSASAFLGGLADTGSRASISQFATKAQVQTSYEDVTPTSLANGGVHHTALEGYNNPKPWLAGRDTHRFTGFGEAAFYDEAQYSPVDANTFTNWQDALRRARWFGGGTDLVVMLTDGNPTAVNAIEGYPFYDPADPYGNILNGVSESKGVQAKSLDPAIVEANGIKKKGARIITVGVGPAFESAESQARLSAISGPNVTDFDAGNLPDLASSDVILTSDFDSLEDAMRQLASDICAPAPDVAVAKSASADLVNSGDDVTYTYEVSNTGNIPLTDVAISDDKCAPLTGPTGDSNANGELDVTEVWVYSCVSALTEDTTNVVTVTANSAVGPVGPVTDTATVKVAIVDIGVTKTVDQPEVQPGDTVVFTVTATNLGRDTATDVVLSDTLEDGLEAISATPAIGTFDTATNTWLIPTLAPGESTTLEMVANVTIEAPVLTNTARVEAVLQGDTNPDNDEAQASVTQSPDATTPPDTEQPERETPTDGQPTLPDTGAGGTENILGAGMLSLLAGVALTGVVGRATR